MRIPNHPLRRAGRVAPALAALAAALATCAAAPAVERTFQLFRFTPTKLAGAAANSVQVAEFRFLRGGSALNLAGVAVTNPGGDNPGTETPDKLVDGNTGTKWLDFNKLGVVFQFPSAVTIDAYSFATANDAPERDPVSWTMEGSNDGAGWTLLDVRKDFATTAARYTWQTNFALSGAVVEQFTADKSVYLNGDTPYLAWSTYMADLGVTIDQGVGAVPESGSLPVTPPDGSDTTYTLTAAGSAGSASRSLTVRTVAGGAVNHRYVRFSQRKLRDDALANSIQLSEFFLLEGATPLTPAGVGNPGGSNPPTEGPANAVDNNYSTKWLDFNKQALVLDLGAVARIDGYGFVTANDAPERDPVRWILEGSDDGAGWTLIENFTSFDFAMPSARTALSQDIPLPGASAAPAVNRFVCDAPKLVAGEPLVLTWEVLGAATVAIDQGIGAVAAAGSLTVQPVADTTYTLTATGGNGRTTVVSLSVAIVQPALTAIQYANFESAGEELALLRDAVLVNDSANIPLPGDFKRLRLNPDAANKTGVAWFRKRMKVAAGFQCSFDMQFNTFGGSGGADGMCFIVQNSPEGNASLPLGPFENGLAAKALNIKFDSYQNAGTTPAEPSAAFVQVRAGDTVLATVNLLSFPAVLPLEGTDPNDLSGNGGTGKVYPVRVEYVPGDLDLYFKGVQVIADLGVDLQALGAVDAAGRAYVGFAARAGGSYESHDITSWFLSEGPPVPPLALKVFSFDFVNDRLTLTWGSSGSKTYRVVASADLLDWSTVLASGIPGAAGAVETTATVGFSGGERFFFRVEAE